MATIYQQGDFIAEKLEGEDVISPDETLEERVFELSGETGKKHSTSKKVKVSKSSKTLSRKRAARGWNRSDNHVVGRIKVPSSGVRLVHPEHPTIVIPEGDYEIRRAVDWTGQGTRPGGD